MAGGRGEFRGDAHTAAWTSAGFDATESGLLGGLFWGLPMKSYSRTRAWSNEQLDAAADRLRARGLLDATGYTDTGRAARELLEANTDLQLAPTIEALGDDLATLCSTLAAWGVQIKAAGGYLSGPSDIAGAR